MAEKQCLKFQLAEYGART